MSTGGIMGQVWAMLAMVLFAFNRPTYARASLCISAIVSVAGLWMK